MAIDKPQVEPRCISAPKTTHLPETGSSRAVVIEPYHVDLLPEYDYVSREYLISGMAAGESYCTRLLLRCPADPSNFTGFVVEEPSHLWGGTSIWRHINRWLMRNGEHVRTFPTLQLIDASERAMPGSRSIHRPHRRLAKSRKLTQSDTTTCISSTARSATNS